MPIIDIVNASMIIYYYYLAVSPVCTLRVGIGTTLSKAEQSIIGTKPPSTRPPPGLSPLRLRDRVVLSSVKEEAKEGAKPPPPTRPPPARARFRGLSPLRLLDFLGVLSSAKALLAAAFSARGS